MASANKKLVNKKVSRALYEFDMIEEGDKLLLGLSGGMDSLVLLHELQGRLNRWPSNFNVKAVFIQSDFAKKGNPQQTKDTEKFLSKLCHSLSIDFEIVNVNIEQRLKENKNLNCYWCSMQRRTELLNLAIDQKCTKLVLGHHLDDMLETFFMNLLYKGKSNGMAPRVDYDKYPLSIIRPLMYVEKKEIKKYIQEIELNSFSCDCSWNKSGNSKRVHIRKHIDGLFENNATLKYNAMSSVWEKQKEMLKQKK